MRDPFMLLFGGSIVAAAIGFWIAFNRPGRRATVRKARVRRWALAGCVVLTAGGLDIAAAYGIGTSTSGTVGVTVELGFAMMALAAVWSIFRKEILRCQLRIGTALRDMTAESGYRRSETGTGAQGAILDRMRRAGRNSFRRRAAPLPVDTAPRNCASVRTAGEF